MKLFKKKKRNPIGSLTLGVEVKNCRDCERCEPRPRAQWHYQAPAFRGPVFFDHDRVCGSCGYRHPRREGDRWNYCPRCGTEMEG